MYFGMGFLENTSTSKGFALSIFWLVIKFKGLNINIYFKFLHMNFPFVKTFDQKTKGLLIINSVSLPWLGPFKNVQMK